MYIHTSMYIVVVCKSCSEGMKHIQTHARSANALCAYDNVQIEWKLETESERESVFQANRVRIYFKSRVHFAQLLSRQGKYSSSSWNCAALCVSLRVRAHLPQQAASIPCVCMQWKNQYCIGHMGISKVHYITRIYIKLNLTRSFRWLLEYSTH